MRSELGPFISVSSQGRGTPAASSRSNSCWNPSSKPLQSSNAASSLIPLQSSSGSIPVRQAASSPNALRPARQGRTASSLYTRVLQPPHPVESRRGIIEVFAPGLCTECLYISKTLDRGCFTVSAGRSTALQVWYNPNTSDLILEEFDTQFSFLGLTSSSRLPMWGFESGQVTAVGGSLVKNAEITTSSSWSGTTWKSIWRVERNGSLVPMLPNRPELAVSLGDGSMRLYVVRSLDGCTSRMGDGYYVADLWFEDVLSPSLSSI